MAITHIRGVALVVSSHAGDLLLLRERETKRHLGKIAGMRSIPMETSRPGESDQAALKELHEQELSALVSIDPNGKYIGVYRITAGVWVRLYATMAANYDLPVALSDNPEVDNHEWFSPREALQLWLRQGAEEMIRDFVGGLENVRRFHCRDVLEKSPVG